MAAGFTSTYTSGLDPVVFPPTSLSNSDHTSIPSSSSSPSSSSAGPTEAVLFSSGNPRIEETRGIMHLYRDIVAPASSSSTSLLIPPIGRKPLVCVLAVPNHMTYADFCRFCGAYIQHMLAMRIVRIDGVDEQYSVIIRFDDQSSTDEFYKHYNGKRFSSLEGNICCVHYTVDVHETELIERAQSSVSSSADCPVCLERLDQDKDTGGILTTICNHSFHCSCISKWTDSSCPVCRYCQQQAEQSTCSICGQSENLWMCVICGFVGCGRYEEGHAAKHWRETQHCYSLELETQRVWDYVGDNYVHRLIQSKTDGKLVELSGNQGDEINQSCDCDEDLSEALLNSKVEVIVEEYNNLLTSQLENQRKHFESLLLETKEDNDKEIAEAIEKTLNAKLPRLQAKLKKAIEERTFLQEINKNLLENQAMWEERIKKAEKREQISTRLKDMKINQLEEQLSALIAQIESVSADQEPSDSTGSEIKNAAVPTLPSSSNGTADSSGRGKETI